MLDNFYLCVQINYLLVRIVLDTNILISATISEYSVPAKVFNILEHKHTLLKSHASSAELKNVIFRNKFDHLIDVTTRGKFLARFLKKAEQVNSTEKITACRDPKDNMILELAVSGKADFIITGDQDVLELDPFRSIRIVTPAEFLEIVEK